MILQKYFLKHIWKPTFCKQYLEPTFKLNKKEYCIIQKMYELLGTDNINWMTYNYYSLSDSYWIIYEYIDPVYNNIVRGGTEFPARIFNRTYEE